LGGRVWLAFFLFWGGGVWGRGGVWVGGVVVLCGLVGVFLGGGGVWRGVVFVGVWFWVGGWGWGGVFLQEIPPLYFCDLEAPLASFFLRCPFLSSFPPFSGVSDRVICPLRRRGVALLSVARVYVDRGSTFLLPPLTECSEAA